MSYPKLKPNRNHSFYIFENRKNYYFKNRTETEQFEIFKTETEHFKTAKTEAENRKNLKPLDLLVSYS